MKNPKSKFLSNIVNPIDNHLIQLFNTLANRFFFFFVIILLYLYSGTYDINLLCDCDTKSETLTWRYSIQ